MTQEYPWMRNVCYEPAPPVRYRSKRLALYLALAGIALAVGALIAAHEVVGF